MDITVKEELRVYIDPLTSDEHDALERSLLAEGCRDALVLWGDVLVDGHNRYGICVKHNIPFNTVQNTHFQSMEDVHLWMIEQHLGRRSVSDFQRGVLALRKKEILAQRSQAVMPSREAVAKVARISSTAVANIERIQKEAAPELVAAVKAGTISINAAAAVATLPVDDQVAAVAGGRKELQQAARQVREVKAKARAAALPPEAAAAQAAELESLAEQNESAEALIVRLQQEVTRLRAENASLKAQLATLRPGDPPWV